MLVDHEVHADLARADHDRFVELDAAELAFEPPLVVPPAADLSEQETEHTLTPAERRARLFSKVGLAGADMGCAYLLPAWSPPRFYGAHIGVAIMHTKAVRSSSANLFLFFTR